MVHFGENIRNVVVNTGNILSLNDITKKPAQNPTEELSEAIKITLKEWNTENTEEHAQNATVTRRHDDIVDKMAAYQRNDLKVGIKLFVNTDSEKSVNDAVLTVITALKQDYLDSLILSYKPSDSDSPEDKLQHLKKLWKPLETLSTGKKIFQIGLSDVEEVTFRALYDWATVKPSIIQINLATCCVVPPSLQAFCKENQVQLLTHSDPVEILPNPCLGEIFEDNLVVNWALRFQVHVKCRGVLTTKGYLVNLFKQ